jgi:hypothetical protein
MVLALHLRHGVKFVEAKAGAPEQVKVWQCHPRKVEMMMVSTARIETSLAMWAQVTAIHVFADRQFVSADPAENRSNVPI